MFSIPSFLIMLREGLEAVLIVSIIASYLKQTGNERWMKFVWLGIIFALLICMVVGTILYITIGDIPQQSQEFFEAVVAVIAVCVLTYMIFWMRKASASIKNTLTERIDVAINRSTGQGIILVGMTFFAVAREGIESMFFLFSFFEQDDYMPALLGSSSGLLVSILLGVAIYLGGIKLNLKAFFRITGIFILFIAAGMAASALAKFHEAGVWNSMQTIVFDVSDTLGVGHTFVGAVLSGLFGFNDHPTVGEVSIYFFYLIPALIFFFWPEKKSDQTCTTN